MLSPSTAPLGQRREQAWGPVRTCCLPDPVPNPLGPPCSTPGCLCRTCGSRDKSRQKSSHSWGSIIILPTAGFLRPGCGSIYPGPRPSTVRPLPSQCRAPAPIDSAELSDAGGMQGCGPALLVPRSHPVGAVGKECPGAASTRHRRRGTDGAPARAEASSVRSPAPGPPAQESCRQQPLPARRRHREARRWGQMDPGPPGRLVEERGQAGKGCPGARRAVEPGGNGAVPPRPDPQ